MNARYLAFLAVVLCGLTTSLFAVQAGRTPSPEAGAVVLLPETLSGRPIQQRWRNTLPLGTLEEGATYAGPAGMSAVQLDFYRNSPERHNGAGCYLAQGESIVWDRPRVLATRHGTAQFDVSLMRARDQLRIVAATECAAQGCAEIAVDEQLSRALVLRVAGMSARPGAFVPVSVVLVRTVSDASEASTAAEMERDLEAAIRELDLDPARRLAALQSSR